MCACAGASSSESYISYSSDDTLRRNIITRTSSHGSTGSRGSITTGGTVVTDRTSNTGYDYSFDLFVRLHV